MHNKAYWVSNREHLRQQNEQIGTATQGVINPTNRLSQDKGQPPTGIYDGR
jgi:hypothetical protein